MIEQFIEIKAANPDSLLFYRMGDFYELFFEDAEIASRTLGIVLTKRGKHLGEDIPMCGVPVVRADRTVPMPALHLPRNPQLHRLRHQQPRPRARHRAQRSNTPPSSPSSPTGSPSQCAAVYISRSLL